MTRSAIPNRRLSPSQARMWLCLTLSAIALVSLLATPIAAQGSAVAPGTPALAAADPAAPAAAKRFSLDFVATDLVDVIKALAAQSGANIAVSAKVQGQVTLRLTEVTVEEALAVVTKINGLEFAKIDTTYVVGTPEEVKALKAVPPPPDKPQVKVVALKYLQAEDAIALLSSAEPQVKCSASPTGGLILTATPVALDRCTTLLAGVDVAPAVGVADRAIYTVKYADCQEMVTTLKAVFPDLTITPAPRTATPMVSAGTTGGMTGATAGLAAPQFSTTGQAGGSSAGGQTSGSGSTAMEMSPVTRLVLSGAPATLARALKLCQDLDVAPRQVKISTTITEISRDVESRLGIDWSDLAGKVVQIGETDSGGDFNMTPARDLKLGKFMRSNFNIAGVINALVTEGTARIMANPSITLLEGRQATIHSGDKILYPQIVGYDNNGQRIVTASEINTGVTLMVNPRLGPEGDITLTLVPTVSSAKPNPSFGGYPTVTERSTVTTVRVKSGETFAIAGLIRDDESVTVTKVPLLGDIPLLGQLFRSKDKHPTHTEVVIIITAEVVQDHAAK
jgi:type II secretory pathway component GspD/PulD (secretin)